MKDEGTPLNRYLNIFGNIMVHSNSVEDSKVMLSPVDAIDLLSVEAGEWNVPASIADSAAFHNVARVD